MTTHNPKFRGTPGPWRVDGHEHKNGVVEYTIVSISGDAVGCAPVAEVLRNNPRPMRQRRWQDIRSKRREDWPQRTVPMR